MTYARTNVQLISAVLLHIRVNMSEYNFGILILQLTRQSFFVGITVQFIEKTANAVAECHAEIRLRQEQTFSRGDFKESDPLFCILPHL